MHEAVANRQAVRRRSQQNLMDVFVVLDTDLKAEVGLVDLSSLVEPRLLLVGEVEVMLFDPSVEVVSQQTAAVELRSGKAS